MPTSVDDDGQTIPDSAATEASSKRSVDEVDDQGGDDDAKKAKVGGDNGDVEETIPSTGTTPAAVENATANADDTLCQTKGYGKLILFGEHFVVYKVPAYVGAVSAYTDCSMEYTDNGTAGGDDSIEIIDNRPAVPGYKVEKADEAKEAINLVLDHFKLRGHNKSIKLTFGGTLCAVSGIGASAAQVVSLARAIQQSVPEFATLTEDEINAAGYEGEKGYHGTPSGIDNTAATFGGLLKFQRTDGEPMYEKKKIAQPIKIVYASTGITSSTTKVVGDVFAKKEADPEWFTGLLDRYCTLATKGEKAMEDGDLIELGKLMDENHTLLQELTVSCSELDDLVIAAREAGAVGAKMSGTGRGGLMLALTPTDEIQDAVAEALGKIAPQVWKTTFE